MIRAGTFFRRARILTEQIREIYDDARAFDRGSLTLWAQLMLDQLEPYVSRGKGRAKHPAPSHNAAAGRSKYTPHQALRECTRRRVGGFAAAREVFAAAGMLYNEKELVRGTA